MSLHLCDVTRAGQAAAAAEYLSWPRPSEITVRAERGRRARHRRRNILRSGDESDGFFHATRASTDRPTGRATRTCKNTRPRCRRRRAARGGGARASSDGPCAAAARLPRPRRASAARRRSSCDTRVTLGAAAGRRLSAPSLSPRRGVGVTREPRPARGPPFRLYRRVRVTCGASRRSMKTAVTVLQEMMVKLGETPEYECIAQSGPQHHATFEYRCAARGALVTAAARSKREAKQEAARRMLLALAARGERVPPPYAQGAAEAGSAPAAGVSTGDATAALGSRSYVALLKELCEEFRLPAAEYELVGDTGPPHLRHFTVRAAVGQHARAATHTTKKAARQLAAEQLYGYLRAHLARLTADFVEEEALARAHERAMERYMEVREEAPWRPHLGQRVADYHCGLTAATDDTQRISALEALSAAGAEPERALTAACAALALAPQWTELAAEGGALAVLELAPAAPALAFAAKSRAQAAARAAAYMKRALRQPAEPAR